MIKERKKKKITLDDLAAMVAEGFEELGTRLDKRIDNLDKRIDDVEFTLSKRIDNVESGLAGLGSRIDGLAYAIKTHLQQSDRRYSALKRRI